MPKYKAADEDETAKVLLVFGKYLGIQSEEFNITKDAKACDLIETLIENGKLTGFEPENISLCINNLKMVKSLKHYIQKDQKLQIEVCLINVIKINICGGSKIKWV